MDSVTEERAWIVPEELPGRSEMSAYNQHQVSPVLGSRLLNGDQCKHFFASGRDTSTGLLAIFSAVKQYTELRMPGAGVRNSVSSKEATVL